MRATSLPSSTLLTAVRERGLTIGSGYGQKKDSTVSIGHMGDHTVAELDVLLETLREVLVS